jgi:hypothetical protein
MTIWERVATALASIGVPCKADKYLPESGGALPDAFIVYSLVSSTPTQHADDAENLRMYRVQVSYFDKSGMVAMPGIKTAMVAAGFTASNATTIPYSEQTGHHGLALEYLYQESEE